MASFSEIAIRIPVNKEAADTPEYMWPAYFSCLMWAATHEDIQKHFTAETGVKFSPPRCGLDAMIDQATGNNPGETFLRAFVPWFNQNVWGPIELEKGTDDED